MPGRMSDRQLPGEKGYLAGAQRRGGSVAAISYDRTADMRKLQPDLVPPAGFQLDFEQASTARRIQQSVRKAGLAACRRLPMHNVAVFAQAFDMMKQMR